MNNKYESKSKVQQILEMPVNVDAIKSTGRVTPSRIAGSSFLSLCNAMELYTSFENRSHDSYIKLLSKEEGKNMIKEYLKWYFKNVVPLFVHILSIMIIAYYLCTEILHTLNF